MGDYGDVEGDYSIADDKIEITPKGSSSFSTIRVNGQYFGVCRKENNDQSILSVSWWNGTEHATITVWERTEELVDTIHTLSRLVLRPF